MSVSPGRSFLYDGLAIAVSLICVVHCLLLPMLLLLLPALAAVFAIPEAFHSWAIAFAVPIGAIALLVGYRRHHSVAPTLVVLPGLALLIVALLVARAAWIETTLTVVGALVLSIGHMLNLRAARIPAPIAIAKPGL